MAERAFARVGRVFGEDGYSVRLARQLANYVSMEFASKGLNLWCVDSQVLPLTAGVVSYNLPADTVSVLDVSYRTTVGGQTSEILMSPLSMSSYQMQVNKLEQGTPLQYYAQRGRDNITLFLWPIPDSVLPYTLTYFRVRRIQDINTIDNNVDVPFRFIPAFTAALTFQLALESPKQMAAAGVQLADVKAVYDDAMAVAQREDVQRVPIRMVPRGYRQ